jgi:hypothetical protein
MPPDMVFLIFIVPAWLETINTHIKLECTWGRISFIPNNRIIRVITDTRKLQLNKDFESHLPYIHKILDLLEIRHEKGIIHISSGWPQTRERETLGAEEQHLTTR